MIIIINNKNKYYDDSIYLNTWCVRAADELMCLFLKKKKAYLFYIKKVHSMLQLAQKGKPENRISLQSVTLRHS